MKGGTDEQLTAGEAGPEERKERVGDLAAAIKRDPAVGKTKASLGRSSTPKDAGAVRLLSFLFF